MIDLPSFSEYKTSMQNFAAVFSLISYVAISTLYFVEREYLWAFIAWAGLLALKLLVKPLRPQAVLFSVIGLCFVFFHGLHWTSPYLQWPLDFFLTALFGFAVLRFGFKRPTEKLKWSFKFSKQEWLSIVVINVPTLAVLVWYYFTHPEVSKMFPVPDLPVWSIPLVILGVAAINGLREEIFYRGFVQPASTNKPVWFVIALQAVLFGFLHFANAFPQGWLGVFLTALWGAAIAIQYRLFKSIALSWLTHAMADALMFSIIIATKG
jgi:CAAX amino terminal protease family.